MAESSLYPGALDDTNLYEVVARLSTTLTADIAADTTTIPLASTTGFPTKGYIVIDNETIEYISVSVGSVDATGGRGHAGTAASHTNTTQVLVAVTAAVINKLRAGMIAIQTYAGTSGGTQGGINAKYLGGNTAGEIVTYGKNLIRNAAFIDSDGDNLPDFWTIGGTPTLAIAADTLFPARGGNQITITCTGAGDEGIAIIWVTANWLKVLPSTKYTFSVDYKVTTGDFLTVYIQSYNGAVGGTIHFEDSTLASTTATRVTYTFTTDADADNLRIGLIGKNDGDIVTVSHPKLEQGANATPYIADNADLVDGVHGSTLAENDIVFTPLGFNFDNQAPASLVEVDGTSIAPAYKHVLIGATQQADAANFKMPRSYDGQTITLQYMHSAATASVTHDLGIRGIAAGSGNTYNPSYGDIVYMGVQTASADSNVQTLATKNMAAVSLGFAVNKICYLGLIGGTVTNNVRIHNVGLRWDKG